MFYVLVGTPVLIAAILGWLYLRKSEDLTQVSEERAALSERYSALEQRFKPAVDLDSEIGALNGKLDSARTELKKFEVDAAEKRRLLASEIETAISTKEKLHGEISLLEENLEDISFGLYKPHFTFSSSEQYKAELEDRRHRQKNMVREGTAAICPLKWRVGDSEKEGQKMVKQYSKLLLRAFNGESDAAVANVTWNNIAKMEERIRRARETLNELGGVMHITLTDEYLRLKLDELRLAHEYEEKKYQEKEEQRRVREQIREEEKAQRELEKAREEAEHEAETYQKVLAQAREEAMSATGTQLQKLTDKIQSLESKLDDAQANKERAVARAQLTKSGFVYVISNIGSFGQKIFKVGMTRRLEPMERVAELGDASVPFPFDLHAMLYSDDAPALEAALHELLEDRRINLINPRKEFFHDVSLKEVESFVRAKGLSAQFVETAEAKEYRQTVALRAQQQAVVSAKKPAQMAVAATASGND